MTKDIQLANYLAWVVMKKNGTLRGGKHPTLYKTRGDARFYECDTGLGDTIVRVRVKVVLAR